MLISRSLYALKQVMIVTCFSFILFPAGHALAQSDLYNRLSRVERDMQTLSKAVYKGDKIPEHMLGALEEDQKYRAQIDVKMNDLETQIRELRGQVEEFDYTLETLNKKIEMIESRAPAGQQTSSHTPNNIPGNLGVNNEIMMTIDGATPSPSEARPEMQGVTNQTKDVLADDSGSTEAYERAFSFLKEGDNKNAQDAFEKFIMRYPQDSLTDNARYWLGETHYVQNEYERAARIFAEAYQKAPKGSKAPDNLLKLGLSLSGLGRRDDACVSFSQLEKEFGQTLSAIVRRGQQEYTKLGCE